jgi:hypothetical protein
MQENLRLKNFSQVYLVLGPVVTTVLAFAVGHSSYKMYLPLWLINACIMVSAMWMLGAFVIRKQETAKAKLAVMALFLVTPWIFISIFGGFGPPPSSMAGWVALATEQQVRFNILIACGISITIGLSLLTEQLKSAGENFFSRIAITCITISVPLFIINMSFWGNYLTEAFQIFVASPGAKRPDWYQVIKPHYFSLSIVEVELIYLATAAFAASLKKAKWFKPAACNVYIIVSFVAFLLVLMPESWPDPFSTIGYVVCIPAFPFIMIYLMGINFLRMAGSTNHSIMPGITILGN